MKLIPNYCANCHQPLGYVTKECLQLPTICIVCSIDDECMKEWGHTIEGGRAEAVETARMLFHRLQERLF